MVKKIVTLLGVLILVGIFVVPQAETRGLASLVTGGPVYNNSDVAHPPLSGVTITFKRTAFRQDTPTDASGNYSTSIAAANDYEQIFTKPGFGRIVNRPVVIRDPSTWLGAQAMSKTSTGGCKPTCIQ